MDRYLVMMVAGAITMLVGFGMTAFTLLVEPEEGVNIGGGFIGVAGLFVLALAGALGGE